MSIITMTPTARTLTEERSLQAILRDYEIHHSTSLSSPTVAEPITTHIQAIGQSSREWDTTHRRVPPYRPIDRERDQAPFRMYTSQAERVFIFVMFLGVLVNATIAKFWRRLSRGRVDSIFKYRVGGEY
ncbi:hypothetical protein F5Y19DRAFT_329244 [Xylariaceae sp. FL1651]|nr:hypothetical protein F5Y19DRAFT_329244 [Xylariaceae sp. FL1651]